MRWQSVKRPGAPASPFTTKYLGAANTLWQASHRSEEHTSELQSRLHLVCRLLLEKKHEVHLRTISQVQRAPKPTAAKLTTLCSSIFHCCYRCRVTPPRGPAFRNVSIRDHPFQFT